MRKTIVVLALLLSGGAALGQDAAEDRHPVEADSFWSITDSDCSLDIGFGDDIAVLINPHDDHFDLGLYDPAMKGVAAEKVIPISFLAAGKKIGGRDYQALGHKADGTISYVSDVDDALLDAIAAVEALEVRRGRTVLADLDMTGFPAALKAMRACAGASQAAAGEEITAAAEAAEAAAAR